jgi:hypothetical protein
LIHIEYETSLSLTSAGINLLEKEFKTKNKTRAISSYTNALAANFKIITLPESVFDKLMKLDNKFLEAQLKEDASSNVGLPFSVLQELVSAPMVISGRGQNDPNPAVSWWNKSWQLSAIDDIMNAVDNAVDKKGKKVAKEKKGSSLPSSNDMKNIIKNAKTAVCCIWACCNKLNITSTQNLAGLTRHQGNNNNPTKFDSTFWKLYPAVALFDWPFYLAENSECSDLLCFINHVMENDLFESTV